MNKENRSHIKQRHVLGERQRGVVGYLSAGHREHQLPLPHPLSSTQASALVDALEFAYFSFLRRPAMALVSLELTSVTGAHPPLPIQLGDPAVQFGRPRELLCPDKAVSRKQMLATRGHDGAAAVRKHEDTRGGPCLTRGNRRPCLRTTS